MTLIENEKVVDLFDSYMNNVKNIVMNIISSVEESSDTHISTDNKILMIKDILDYLSDGNEELIDNEVDYGDLIPNLVERYT